ncbi:hypothetical protein J3Q64DRAFT_1837623 [Phycomyces blakesleeanus]|uniref:MADF domain-containing protein n=1 Tax=Phycomyces blakesleeanus TaxID=4837 RepID=A0ABR3ASQ6_PHYBL
MNHNTSSINSGAIKKKVSSRGKWDNKRKLALMQAYHEFHPYSQLYRNRTQEWNKIISAVNAMGDKSPKKLKKSCIKNKKNKMFREYQKVMSLSHSKRWTKLDSMLQTTLGRATYETMQEKDKFKEGKILKKVSDFAKTILAKNRGDEIMHIALYSHSEPEMLNTNSSSSRQQAVAETLTGNEEDEREDKRVERYDDSSDVLFENSDDVYSEAIINRKILSLLKKQDHHLEKQDQHMEKQEAFFDNSKTKLS